MRRIVVTGLLVLLVSAPGRAADHKDTISYLQSLQTPSGGFRLSAKADAPGLRATSGCLRALKYFGGMPKDVESCKKFVLSCHDAKTGGFADTPGGKPDVILTAVGLMALVELKIPTEPYEKAAIAYMADNAKEFEQIRMVAAGLETIQRRCDKNANWLRGLATRQNADGTFGKGKGLARDTGSAVACLLRLGGKVRQPDVLVMRLDKDQRDDGAFGEADAAGSDLETTYRVMRTYVMLKAKPARADALRAFIARCKNPDGGYGVTPGAPSSASGTYFASILLHWLDLK